MSDTHDSLIQQFCEVTGLDPQSARQYLEASNWNIEIATAQAFDPDGQDDVAPSSSSAMPGSSSSGPASQPKEPKAKSKFASFGDISGRGDNNDDDEDERLYAGGEKSALAITPGANNSGDSNSGNHLIKKILDQAVGAAHEQQDSSPRPPRFTGSGRTLGGEGTESMVIPDPNPPAPSATVVDRSLTFWRNGFSVEDGPLYAYDNPNSQQILQAIESGRAPLHLMNVEVGQTANVRVYKRFDQDYVPPKQKPFSGAGQRLGDASTAPPAPAASQQTSTQPSVPMQPQNAPTVDLDSSAPTTSIQIRLGDGTRLVSRFNHTHTVADIYNFVNAASVTSRSRNYVLQTTFPNRELRDHALTIKDAGLVNAVVVQKWVS
ncbi:SEP-domain-containing protein [Ascodesmis nigricans]|uniref:SEP-domain-containing protein n=1 Tax=Ascodesmis nigricans TaxID=341454 RepID=A0A4S2N7F1_9PEZI|nr:SEP-domain-containing protein [Ascodesmis nigricans]